MIDTYLNLDGIPGEALDDKHQGWIEVLSYGHEMNQPVSGTKSSAGGAPTGRSEHKDIIITKYVDKASTKLYAAVSSGKPVAKAKLEFCRAGGSQVKFLEINLEEVVISHVSAASNAGGTTGSPGTTGTPGSTGTTGSTGTSGQDLPVEEVHLNYAKIEWIYTQQKRKDGSGGGNVTAKHDLTTGKTE